MLVVDSCRGSNLSLKSAKIRVYTNARLHPWPNGKMLALYAVDRGSIPVRLIPKL